jgi:outer membrane protein OmpA-like peptidoglycan-associated protein
MPMILAKLVAPLMLALALSSDPFSFEFPGTTDGKGNAYLVIRANEPISGAEVVIEGDGKTIRKTLPNLKQGQTHKFTWKQSAARAKYELEIKGGGLQASFGFEVGKAVAVGPIGKLQLTATREDIVKRHHATYKTPFAIASYEYKVYDGDGDVIASDVVTGDLAPGSSFTIKWQPTGEVFMIQVRAEDQHGRFAEDTRVPWAVEIPHTEITFDSGKHNIKVDEAPKLDEALAVAFHELVALDKVNQAVRGSLTPKLFIVGYTDTVGPAGSNQKLSTNRARAIAEYFHERGFWAEIHYAGMGERGLRIETGDNVDEVRNRRALYLLGVDKPIAGGQIPASWTKLAGARSKPAGFELPPLPERWKDYREKRRAENLAAGEGVDTSLPDSGDEGFVAADDGAREPGGGYDFSGSDDGPPAIEGEPGATKKGCTVDGPSGGALGWLVLAALALTSLRRRAGS